VFGQPNQSIVSTKVYPKNYKSSRYKLLFPKFIVMEDTYDLWVYQGQYGPADGGKPAV
jgi:hypothetical protein